VCCSVFVVLILKNAETCIREIYCCSVLQCVVVCCSVFVMYIFQVYRDMCIRDTLLQCIAVRDSVLQYVCSIKIYVRRDMCMRYTLLQCVAMCCSVFVVYIFELCRDIYMRDILLQCVAVCSNVLQYVCSVDILSMQRHVYEKYVVAVCYCV